MSIYKQATSRFWWYAFRVGKGYLRGSTGTENEAVARAVEQTVRSAYKKELPVDKLHALIDTLLDKSSEPGLLLAGVWPEYERYLRTSGREIKPRTSRGRELSLARFVGWATADRPACTCAEHVDRSTAAAYADWLASTGTMGKTRANQMGDLGTIWEGLRRVRDGIKENPWPLVTPAKNDSKRGKAFDRTEEAAVIAAADKISDEWGLACRIARYTGLRYGDVARMTWDAVDLDTAVIRLEPAKTSRHGIAVIMPLAPPLETALRAARDADAETRFVMPKHAAAYPRPEHHGLSGFAAVLDAAGLADGGFTFHSWRHTFRTRLSEAGVSDEIAKRLGGWTKDETAMRYDHDGRERELREAIVLGAM